MPDVVIVGAGLAGLRCAEALVDRGADVVVLEARDRVGGRVFSHHFADGQTCERGAEFVDSNHAEVLALAARLGLSLSNRNAVLDPAETLLDAGGRAVPMSMHASLEPDVARWDNVLANVADDAQTEHSTLADLMHSLDLSVLSRLVVGRHLRTEYMLPPEEVSQRFAGRLTRLQAAGSRECHRVIGGNDQLATGLAARLGARIKLSTAVQSIESDTGAITLRSGEVLAASSIVAAVPLPVLSRLWSAMPLELGAVGYGVGGKVSVQFDRRIWHDYGRNGTVLSERAWGHLWETTDDQGGDRGVLTNLLSSHDGAAFAALPEAPDRIVAEIERLFPGAKGLSGERVHTDWTNDPSSLGAYSCFGPGQLAAAEPFMHAAHGRMRLAGEHTDEFSGFMEGALRSGTRAAAAITG
ncbi:MAG: monoamine oxidase [Ilumatobacteraceae bacterium]|nr:monoamine oxidase [Ilumatobacteraceae bacterium]